MILEFAALSRLTGNPVFEAKAARALAYLWKQRNRGSDLVGQVINVESGDWVRFGEWIAVCVCVIVRVG